MPTALHTYLVKVVTTAGITTYPAIHAGAAEAIGEAMALFPGARTVAAKPLRTHAAR